MEELELQNERKILEQIVKKSMMNAGDTEKLDQLWEYFRQQKFFLKTMLTAFNLQMFTLSLSP